MSKFLKFPCGCSIPIDELLPLVNGQPSLIYPEDVNDLSSDCPHTWEMLATGSTKGIFQLESPLGRQYVKKLKPGVPNASEGIEHLAALGSILRPGSLKAKMEDGLSITEHYCLRKNNLEEVSYYHPSLEPMLKPTYGMLVFQEQSMAIAVALAGFSPMEADDLRKAIGKKKTDVMAKVKAQFIEKADKLGIINPEQAAEIFGWIEKSQRYQFNKSHAVSYALIGYHTAHLKAHFPLQFYTSFLYYAKEKQDPLLEIRQLVNDAKTMGIEVVPPRFEDAKANFNTDGIVITFGLSDIKGLGRGHINKLKQVLEVTEMKLDRPRMTWDWLDFLIHFSPACASTVVKRMIEVGGLRKYKLDRQRMLYEYNAYSQLTEKEQSVVSQLMTQKHREQNLFDDESPKITNIVEAVEILLDTPKGVANKNRRDKVGTILKMLKTPPRSLVDTSDWIAKTEEECLGIPITCSRVEGVYNLKSDTTCKEFREGKEQNYMTLAVEIQEVKEHRIQNGDSRGRTMAFLTVSDQSGSLDDICIFADAWSKFGNMIHSGNTVEMRGRRDPKKGSFVVEEAWKV